MNEASLLLCCDMDRTVMPNGSAIEHPEARPRFRRLCEYPDVRLVYVTGRHQALVEAAIEEYDLPQPNFVITDVGSRICRVEAGHWQDLSDWQQLIAEDWRGYQHAELAAALQSIDKLVLQEAAKQNDFKLSFYAPLDCDEAELCQTVQAQLDVLGVRCKLIWSIDEPAQTALLDVLPARADKLQALLFLKDTYHLDTPQIVFAGDSGNDLAVLTSPINSVLVNNASDEIKARLKSTAADDASLYLAQNPDMLGMNGNYTAGVLAGVWHYVPGLRSFLEQGET